MRAKGFTKLEDAIGEGYERGDDPVIELEELHRIGRAIDEVTLANQLVARGNRLRIALMEQAERGAVSVGGQTYRGEFLTIEPLRDGPLLERVTLNEAEYLRSYMLLAVRGVESTEEAG